MPSYRCLQGLNYIGGAGAPVRREPGDVADDIPTGSVGWLTAQGHIEPAVAGMAAPVAAPEAFVASLEPNVVANTPEPDPPAVELADSEPVGSMPDSEVPQH